MTQTVITENDYRTSYSRSDMRHYEIFSWFKIKNKNFELVGLFSTTRLLKYVIPLKYN